MQPNLNLSPDQNKAVVVSRMTSGIWKKIGVCRVQNVACRGKKMLLIEEEVGQNLGTLWVQASAVMFTKNNLAMDNSEF